ncbi:MAG: hypothetical protein DME18_09515 [Verrucomicrobia bacterium]|nr:MAG: hypothetical protein DME18_09515 [Verrucomicrobiota bacterium]
MRNFLCAVLTCACLTAAHGTELRFSVIDSGTGKPLPCRIHMKDPAGKVVRPKTLPFWHDHFVCAGVAELELAPGSYPYEIDRGPEYLLTTGTLTVADRVAQSVTNQLRRLVDLSREGWWSGELHVHRPPGDIELLMQAEDLHVAPVITWWNNRNTWTERAPPANPLVRFDGDRFYHLMGGEDERAGGALLYFNLGRPLDIAGADREYPSPMKFLAEVRLHTGAWVDIEKPFWYDAPVWLASGMVDSIGIAHNHMHRGGVLPNEAWGRPRDKERFPDPQGNGYWTQEIYYHILDCGLRLPPSAGSASGVLPNPVGYDRVYVHLDGELSYERWWEALRAGRVFVSNGPLLRCRADGQLPGHIFKVRSGETLDLYVNALLDSRDPISSLEIIQNGRVTRAVSYSEWKRTGSLGTVRFNDSGWFLIRAIADVPGTFRFASTGPFYVEIGPAPRRVSKASAQFFLDWVRERVKQVRLDDAHQKDEVLQHHRAAERFWEGKVTEANAD